MKRVAGMLVVCLAVIGAGCSAVASRTAVGLIAPAPPLYFGGVRTDYEVIAAAKECDGSLFWPVYGVIDLPFSFGADILLVPYDIYTDCRHPGSTANELR